MTNNKCRQCNKEATIKGEPSRHACSPNSINWNAKSETKKYYDHFCSKECQKKYNELNYALWAEQDRNASDGECFIHEKWENGYRTGRCSITGAEVKVEPLQPSNNSGQPKECTEHFKLKKRYQDILDQLLTGN